MAHAIENRKHQRHTISFVMFPILVQAPKLSGALMDPMDVSMGGFRVEVPEEPDIGDLIECSVELKGVSYDDCRAQVAWKKKTDQVPPTWHCGLSLDIPEKDRGDFHKALTNLLIDLGYPK